MHHHHQVDDDEEDDQRRADEMDRPRRLPAAEELDQPGEGRVEPGDMASPVSTTSGRTTTTIVR